MADEEVIYLIDSDSDNDNGSSSQAKDDACTSTKPIIPKKIDAAPCKPLGKSTVEKRGLIDLPRDTDSDDSDDDFLNLPVFRPKVAADQSKGIKSRNVKHQASTSKGVNLYDERMKEEQQDNGVVDLSVSGMHSRTDSSDDEVCYHIGRLDQSGTGAGSSCGNGDGDGAANETEDDDCIILSSDDDSDKHCKPSSSKGFAVAARSKEIMNDIDSDDDESDKICKPSSKRFAVAARSKEIMNDIDSDDNDDDDLPSPVPFKLQTKEKVENKRRGTFVSEHSSPNADGADLMNSTKASKGTHKQSPRGTLKDDRYYESNDSPSQRGVLKDDRHYESNDSPSSWNFISHQHSNKSEHSSPNADGAAFMNSTKASKGTHKQSLRGALKDDRHYESNDSPSSWNLISHKHSKKVNGNYGHAGLNGNNVPSLFRSASNEIVLDSDSDIDDSPRPPVGAAAKSRQPIQNSYTQSRPAPLNNTDVGLFSPPNATLPTSRQNVHNSSTSNAIQFDDLISPRASIGRPSIGSVGSTNSRRKIKVPTPAIPVKITNEIGGKLYPDFRNHFIKALIKSAKMARRAVHTKGALDGSIRAIIALAFYPFPIRSANGTMTINGIGANLVDVLKEAEKEVKKKNPPYNPPNGLYSSAAAAALVVLYKHESGKTGEDRYLSMEDLIQRVNQKSHCTTGGRLFDRDNQYYLDSNNLDPSWMQIRKLCSSFIKERARKKACASGLVYELLEEGRKEARQLMGRMAQGPVPDGPLRQLAADTVSEEFGNVTVVIDGREGGGGSRKLHDFCEFMDDNEVPYVVRNLKISDYVFFIGNKLAPVLIERKSVEDVASSLFDGRWESQQKKMRKAQYVLGGGDARKCHLCYLIEGDVDKTIAHGGFVGRSNHRKSVQDVKNAIAGLPELGFSVIESRTQRESLNKIKRVAKEFLWRSKNGSIDCTQTYDEFISKVNRVGDEKGNPPTDPVHKNPAPPIVDDVVPIHPNVTNPDAVDGNDGDAVESEETKEKREELLKLSMKELKERCRERTEKMAGKKKDLVDRLLQKRQPEILISRARQKQHTPKVPSCNAAILVALHLHHEPGEAPLEKAKIMNYAEESGVSKDPMFGTGKGWYDGWAGIKDLTGGDPALVSVVKRKYALTKHPPGSSGIEVARAIHIMAHRVNRCRCGQFVEEA